MLSTTSRSPGSSTTPCACAATARPSVLQRRVRLLRRCRPSGRRRTPSTGGSRSPDRTGIGGAEHVAAAVQVALVDRGAEPRLEQDVATTSVGQVGSTSWIDDSVVAAAGSPRRHSSSRYRGRCGWNAASVWNISVDLRRGRHLPVRRGRASARCSGRGRRRARVRSRPAGRAGGRPSSSGELADRGPCGRASVGGAGRRPAASPIGSPVQQQRAGAVRAVAEVDEGVVDGRRTAGAPAWPAAATNASVPDPVRRRASGAHRPGCRSHRPAAVRRGCARTSGSAALPAGVVDDDWNACSRSSPTGTLVSTISRHSVAPGREH